MSKEIKASDSTGGSPPPNRRGGPQEVLAIVNGVLAGLGTLYVTTKSLEIVIVGSIVAVLLALACMAVRR